MSVQASLSPQFIAQIRELDLRARLVVEGFLTGLHRSPYHGFSVEFAEYRAYMPGDDVKHLDWKALARSDRYYVKEFEEETNLKAYILLDTSASMGYHNQGSFSKLEYGACLAASLAYLMLSQHDAVGLALFDQRLRQYLPPRSRRSHWNLILQSLDRLAPSGTTSFSDIFAEMAGHLKRRGLIVIISDLWDDPGRVAAALKHLRHLKHEVLVFHLLDHDELTLPFKGPSLFQDMETRESVELRPELVGRNYRQAVGAWIDGLARECRQHLIDYQQIDTRTPFDQSLLAYLYKRQRLG